MTELGDLYGATKHCHRGCGGSAQYNRYWSERTYDESIRDVLNITDSSNLSIPSIGLALPVMQQWSYPGLKIAPGRYFGSLYTDDLVIAGHNYARHFSPLTQLTVGTEVLFVDMNDNTWHYAVSDTEVLQPTQIEEMAVKTPENNWDLTLFTCTTTGQARYALRCVRTDE